MTKKDFLLIAATIKSYQPAFGAPDRHALACHFAAALATTNPLFNRERFIRACGA